MARITDWTSILRRLRRGGYILATYAPGRKVVYTIEPGGDVVSGRMVDDAIDRGELRQRDVGLIPQVGTALTYDLK